MRGCRQRCGGRSGVEERVGLTFGSDVEVLSLLGFSLGYEAAHDALILAHAVYFPSSQRLPASPYRDESSIENLRSVKERQAFAQASLPGILHLDKVFRLVVPHPLVAPCPGACWISIQRMAVVWDRLIS